MLVGVGSRVRRWLHSVIGMLPGCCEDQTTDSQPKRPGVLPVFLLREGLLGCCLCSGSVGIYTAGSS